MSESYKHSYWNNRGRYKDYADKLNKLIPSSGPCPEGSPALDRYRIACNCYYDLFNNGLWNRAAEFRAVFKFSPKKEYPARTNGIEIRRGGVTVSGIEFEDEAMNARLNAALDLLIVEAAIEQGLWPK